MGEKRELEMKLVTDKAMAEVRFCSHFSFSRAPFPVPRSPFHVLVLSNSLTVHNPLFKL